MASPSASSTSATRRRRSFCSRAARPCSLARRALRAPRPRRAPRRAVRPARQRCVVHRRSRGTHVHAAGSRRRRRSTGARTRRPAGAPGGHRRRWHGGPGRALDYPDAFSALTLAGTRPVAPGGVDEDLPDHDAATMERLFSRPMPDWPERAAVAEVDTGMTELHPAVANLDPRLRPLSTQDFDLAGIDIVVNTHLHFDHCGGNHLFADRPIYVQRRELDDARSEDDYTIREWVEAPGVRYVPVDGELELLPGLQLVPAPGHTRGMHVVVVETGGRRAVVGVDVAVWFGELDEPHTEGQLRVRALDPELVWLAHEHQPWRPRTV